MPVCVSVAVVNGALLRAVWYPDISTDREFGPFGFAKGSCGGWGCPVVTSTPLKWDQRAKEGSAGTESQAENPFLFLMRSFTELIQGFSWSTPERRRGSDKRKRSQNAPKKLLCVV